MSEWVGGWVGLMLGNLGVLEYIALVWYCLVWSRLVQTGFLFCFCSVLAGA